MHRISLTLLSLVLSTTLWIAAQDAAAQAAPSVAAPSVAAPSVVTTAPDARDPGTGPHGGTVKTVAGRQLEIVLDASGIRVYVTDDAGQTVSTADARGTAILDIEDQAKRYRYSLLPDGQGALAASVNLSAWAGRQVQITAHLVGFDNGDIRFTEVTSIAASEAQLTAEAIARQQVCPVSGKPLGSMGTPIRVNLADRSLFVCCAGCVATVQADPAKYATSRPPITVTSATAADAAAIAKQQVCPVMDEPLGSMGAAVKLLVGQQPIFLCCRGCIKKVQQQPETYLAKVYGDRMTADSAAGATDKTTVPAGTKAVREGVFEITAADAPFVAAQAKCPVMDEPLQAMGGPYKVHAAGRAIYICCPGCAKRIAADPDRYLTMLRDQGVTAPLLQ